MFQYSVAGTISIESDGCKLDLLITIGIDRKLFLISQRKNKHTHTHTHTQANEPNNY